jgi:hypothetical protein
LFQNVPNGSFNPEAAHDNMFGRVRRIAVGVEECIKSMTAKDLGDKITIALTTKVSIEKEVKRDGKTFYEHDIIMNRRTKAISIELKREYSRAEIEFMMTTLMSRMHVLLTEYLLGISIFI